jgi:hypothetical protein
LYWLWEYYEHVGGIAITAQSVGDVAIVARVVHGSANQTINKQRIAVFVDLVLDTGVHGDFDNYVKVIGQAFARRDKFKTHDVFLTSIE